MSIESGTFFFQWVHCEKETTRDPHKNVDKVLYLVYVKDLVVHNKKKKRIVLPRRSIEYNKDFLTQHFYNTILNHEDSFHNSKKHTLACKCEI